MIQILVVTHGDLAEEFIKTTQKVLDKPINAASVCLDFGLNHSACAKKITKVMSLFKPEDSVIILTDILGGTSSAITIPFIKKDKVEVITGVNLAMLVYLLSQPGDKSFRKLCEEAKKAAKEAIVIAGDFLSGK